MPTQDISEYQIILSQVIKKQLAVLGPDVTLTKLAKINGIKVSDTGTIMSIHEDPTALSEELIEEFMSLSGPVVHATMQPLLDYHAQHQEQHFRDQRPKPND